MVLGFKDSSCSLLHTSPPDKLTELNGSSPPPYHSPPAGSVPLSPICVVDRTRQSGEFILVDAQAQAVPPQSFLFSTMSISESETPSMTSHSAPPEPYTSNILFNQNDMTVSFG